MLVGKCIPNSGQYSSKNHEVHGGMHGKIQTLVLLSFSCYCEMTSDDAGGTTHVRKQGPLRTEITGSQPVWTKLDYFSASMSFHEA